MDVRELHASLQALMDQQQEAPRTAQSPATGRADVLVATAPDLPVALIPDRSNEFDDHLLVANEEAGDVKITNLANAIYRAKRTGFQGLLASVLISVGGVLAALKLDAEIDWRLLALSLSQAVITAVITFLHNDKSADTE